MPGMWHAFSAEVRREAHFLRIVWKVKPPQRLVEGVAGSRTRTGVRDRNSFGTEWDSGTGMIKNSCDQPVRLSISPWFCS